jgi:hypothetical protein
MPCWRLCPLGPPPAEVLRLGAARSSIDDALDRAACALVERLLLAGEEVGVHVVALHEGPG